VKKKKKKMTIKKNPKYFYTLKFERKFNIFGPERTRVNLQIEHKSSQVRIEAFPKLLNESVDNKSDGNVNTIDRLSTFPWHSIRKWHVNGSQLDMLYCCLKHKWNIIDNAFVKEKYSEQISRYWKNDI
ncbi:hypothetical protein RFI_33588, partial [Reticulomyxa filosa]